MKWVTRSHLDVGRVACCWLITRFVDSDAEFLFAPQSQVDSVTEELGAIMFDVPAAELTSRGGRCSFEVMVGYFGLADDALLRLARVIHGAALDDGHADPAAPGLRAIAEGYSLRFPDDCENVDRQLEVYDALYGWCQLQVAREEEGLA
jgi:hypothetical protein